MTLYDLYIMCLLVCVHIYMYADVIYIMRGKIMCWTRRQYIHIGDTHGLQHSGPVYIRGPLFVKRAGIP